jgi:hypothetical protein
METLTNPILAILDYRGIDEKYPPHEYLGLPWIKLKLLM